MIESAMASLPVLTDVVQPSAVTAPQLQDRLVQALPGLVRQAVHELQPQLEQHLLDALMPRLLAALAQWQADAGPNDEPGGSRLP